MTEVARIRFLLSCTRRVHKEFFYHFEDVIMFLEDIFESYVFLLYKLCALFSVVYYPEKLFLVLKR